jgi:hypothetical protein
MTAPPLSEGEVGRDDDRRGFGVLFVFAECILLLAVPPGVALSLGGVFAEVVRGVAEAPAVVVVPSIIGGSMWRIGEAAASSNLWNDGWFLITSLLFLVIGPAGSVVSAASKEDAACTDVECWMAMDIDAVR